MQHTRIKIDVEKFDGKGDFGMWKFKMQMQLENSGLDSVLMEDRPSSSSEKGILKDDKDEEKPVLPPGELTGCVPQVS